jgi:acetyl esterase/lipase
MLSLQSYLLKFFLRRSADRGLRVSVQEFRDAFHRRSVQQGKVAPGTRVELTEAGGCAAEWLFVPTEEVGPTILHFHGGGYVFASARTHRGFVSQILARSGGKALVLDYRRAPEHPFPAALDDAIEAYRWLLDRPVPPEQIAFAGESAGAGLALATMLRAREEGLPLPSCVALVSPWVDLTHSGASIVENEGKDVLLRGEQLRSWAAMYAGDHDRKDPLVSPIYADLHGFPPLWMCVERDELLYSETVLLADRMKQAGAEVHLEVVEGLMHVWPFFYSALPEGKQTIRHLADFIKDKASAPEASSIVVG